MVFRTNFAEKTFAYWKKGPLWWEKTFANGKIKGKKISYKEKEKETKAKYHCNWLENVILQW